nr:FAD-dependent oxidoreductase [Desulfobacula sp.]
MGGKYEKTTPNVLILGGGVAGMAAARTLGGRDVLVHLVEKENSLGGHAAKWSCMATHACENCGACLSIEAADQAPLQKNLKLHLNTRVRGLEKKDSGYEVVLENKESFTVQKIIMATGFSPFDPKNPRPFIMGTAPGSSPRRS